MTPASRRLLLVTPVVALLMVVGVHGQGRQRGAPAVVEDGTAPETLTATRRDQGGAVTRSRPLCQHPQVAKYKGSGSTDDAVSFTCSNGF